MKQTLPDIIRKNDNLRQLLLAQKGGIMKFLAEHLDAKGTAALFCEYQNQCVEEFFEKNKWDLHVVWAGDVMKRAALGEKEHLRKEFHYQRALMSQITEMSNEISEILEQFTDLYLDYAYKQHRLRWHPNGLTDMDIYQEVIGMYHTTGLAYKCMNLILKEHNTIGEFEKTESDLWTEYVVRQWSAHQTLSLFGQMRQAVNELFISKTDDQCRQMAIDTMKIIRSFSQRIYSDTMVQALRDINYIKEAERRECEGEWLRDVAQRAVLEEYFNHVKHYSMRYYFANFVNILIDLGRIWAAQLLAHGIDMKELETGVACILNPDNTPRYYVDKHYFDELPNKYCVSNDSRAEELLKRIGRKTSQKCYLQFADNADESDVRQKLYRAHEILSEEKFLDKDRTTLAVFTDVLLNNSDKIIVWKNDSTHKFLKEFICVFLGISNNYNYPAILKPSEEHKQWAFIEQHFIDDSGSKIKIKSNTTKLGKKDKGQFERILKKIYFSIIPKQKS